MSPRHVAVVPHTHWDREWYEPFQTFRLKLVQLLDQLIPLLETDPSYAHYLLDGQMAVVDDYLEVRPEMEDRLRRLAASGRLAMGPWYILVDEFLVTGETMIRDLQLGIERGAAFGGVTSVGYLPDMFGHIAQMPQILSQAGFADTVLWRGVPSAVTKTGFRWVAPDGSAVRAEYLITGYGNAASLPDDAKALLRRAHDYIEEVESFLFDDLLFMNGSDHLLPQRHLGRVLAEANEMQDELHFTVSSIADYLDRAPRTAIEEWHGELRSGFRSNILMGVLSNRVDVKKAAAVVERQLERRAEPYAALFTPATTYPAALLRLAWREVIRNAAHDSICACSVDDTVDAVLHRFNEARQIAAGLASQSLQHFATELRQAGTYVVNGRSDVRQGLVEFSVAGDQFNPATMQLIEERPKYPEEMTLNADGMRAILSIVQDNRIDDQAFIHEATLDTNGDVITVHVTAGSYERKDVDFAQGRQELYAAMGANPEKPIKLTLIQPAIRKVVGLVREIPPFGWAPAEAMPASHPVVSDTPLSLSNGRVSVVVDPDSGTFSLNGRPGYGKLVDDGDLGDSYNYSPPAQQVVIDQPDRVEVRILESGPVRGRLAITSTFTWPSHIDEATQSRVGAVASTITTIVEIRADDPAVHVTTRLVNPARDHRLRVHLPLPTPTTHSEAECAFTVVERGLSAEGRSEEFGLPTFPSRRFVRAGSLTVAHEGLHEYELVDITADKAHTLALTLLRATGMLSRLGMTMRPLPAGPLTPVEGLQLVGVPLELHYSLTDAVVDPYAFAADALLPLDVITAPGGGLRQERGSMLEIRGAEVSAVTRVNGVLEIRVFNPTNEATEVEVPGRHGWLVDLRGAGLAPFEGQFALRPHGIATFRLHD